MDIKPEEVKTVEDLDLLIKNQQEAPRVFPYVLAALAFPPLGLFLAWKKKILYAVLPDFLLYQSILFCVYLLSVLYILTRLVGLTGQSGGFTALLGKPVASIYVWTSVALGLGGLVAAIITIRKAKRDGNLTPFITVALCLLVAAQYIAAFSAVGVLQGIILDSLGGMYQQINSL